VKIIVASLVCLFIGFGVGWHFAYTTAERREVREELDDQEMSSGAAATFAVEAVKCIDSGDTQKAVQFLSLPIADYCTIYKYPPTTNESLIKLRARIDQLALTNHIVAAQIKKDELLRVRIILPQNEIDF
jgi:hypothetical protein